MFTRKLLAAVFLTMFACTFAGAGAPVDATDGSPTPGAEAVRLAQAPSGSGLRRDAPAGSDMKTAPGSGGSGGRLSVRGADIVDPSGAPILLRGWNWGHWGKGIEADAADNAAQGANVVRIPLRWWGAYKGKTVDSRNDSASSTASIDPTNLAMLDDYVRWASKAHLWIVLFIDSNCGQNGLQPDEPTYCDPRGEFRNGHNFWSDPAMRARFVNVWRFIANRYKDTPYLGMFEPLPEPNPAGVSPSDIVDFYTQVMNAIREVAPGVPFLVGPEGYKAAKIREIYNPAWKDVVYTGNLFLHQKKGLGELKQRMQALLDMRNDRRVPIFVQQVGVRSGEDPDLSALRGTLSMLNQNRVGYAYWEYRGAMNADEYGVLYQRGNEWVTKRDVLSEIAASFKR